MTACVLALILAGAARTVAADWWTNAAGHAVEAEFVRLDGNRVVLKTPAGEPINLALSSLAPADRRKALDAAGRITVPDALKTDYGLCVRTLQRLDELRKAGGLTDDAYAEQREAALDRFRKRLEKETIPEPDRLRLLILARNH